jgi:hypothetical protein
VPSELKAIIKEEDQDACDVYPSIKPDDPININLVGVSTEIKNRRLERLFKPAKVLSLEEKAFRTVYLVRVRPPVFTLEKRGEKIVDDRGFEYKAFDVYVASDTEIPFPPSSLIRLTGIPLPNPRTQKTTFLAFKAEFPEAAQSFDVTKLSTLRAALDGKTAEERLHWILDNFEKYAQIVGRRNLAEACFLIYFTPAWVRFNGEIQRGWGNGEICGDTTTAKTETVRKMIMLLKAGALITAETASSVGLIGTATQIEKEGWTVDWGFLVLQDQKLLAVDGAHKLSSANWAALAEAERSGVVTIAKAAKNTAYARTRQIKIANAVDREADKYSTKSLASFLYPCQSLSTILDKTSIARLDLAVFADQRDVAPELINTKFDGSYDENLKLLGESLKWCWGNAAHVEFTDAAVTTLLAKATELHHIFFCEMIPLASIDLKWKLARLSVAMAYLTLSTEDFKTVTITEDHVNLVVEFLSEEYTRAGLNILAQETRFEILDVRDVQVLLQKITGSIPTMDLEKLTQILRYIVTHGRITKDELTTRFSLTEKNEARPLLASLKSEGLVKVSKGFYPEPKLIEAYKITGGFVFS